MTLNLEFCSLREKQPNHGDRIAFFDVRYDVLSNLKEGTVFYSWVDSEGGQYPYDPSNPHEGIEDGCTLGFFIEYGEAGWDYGQVGNLKEPLASNTFWVLSKVLDDLGGSKFEKCSVGYA